MEENTRKNPEQDQSTFFKMGSASFNYEGCMKLGEQQFMAMYGKSNDFDAKAAWAKVKEYESKQKPKDADTKSNSGSQKKVSNDPGRKESDKDIV